MDYYPPDAQPAQKAVFPVAQSTCNLFIPAHPLFAAMRTIAAILLVPLLGLSTSPVYAGNGPPLAWACWLSEQMPVSIKCIRDRSMLRQNMMDDEEAALRSLQPGITGDSDDEFDRLPQGMPGINETPGAFPGRRSLSQLLAQDEPENEIETEVLNEIYSKILMGDTARLDNLVERHMGSLRENSILAIKIYTPPLESSWRENQPLKIVRSALCQKKPTCRVILNKPDY